jgi:hypothetical protein
MITDNVTRLHYDVEPWFMSGFDFRCVWEALGLDRLPFPLAYRIRDRQYMSEVAADRRDSLARQRASLTQNRVRILEALRFPAFMMHGFGRIEAAAGLKLYRLFAVVGSTGYCAVIIQEPSEQVIFGEDVQIIGCANVDFPEVVVKVLPEYSAGTKPRKYARFEDEETPEEFFAESSVTSSILLAGSAEFTLDYELRNANHLTLVNVADDGAYLVNEGSYAFQIIPATVPNLLEAFQKVEELQSKVAERLSSATSSRDFDGIS